MIGFCYYLLDICFRERKRKTMKRKRRKMLIGWFRMVTYQRGKAVRMMKRSVKTCMNIEWHVLSGFTLILESYIKLNFVLKY